jgi:hypothetical protein
MLLKSRWLGVNCDQEAFPDLDENGVILVEKLRTVILFQGYFNYLNKYIGIHMMKDG